MLASSDKNEYSGNWRTLVTKVNKESCSISRQVLVCSESLTNVGVDVGVLVGVAVGVYSQDKVKKAE